MKKIILILTLLSLGFAFAQSETEFRASASIRFSPFKKIKLYLSPELRFTTERLDKILAGAEIKVSPLKVLDMGLGYKAVVNYKNDGSSELIHRIEVYSETEHDLGRFTPGIRIMYVNYDEDEGVSHFLRYKVKLAYNIPKSKIDPSLSAELYHQLTGNTLYKMRYSIGADWRFAKQHSLGLAYKLDDYLGDTKLKHVVELGYAFKF